MKNYTEFPKYIKSESLELKLLEPTFENAKNIFDTVKKSQEHVSKWLGWAEPGRLSIESVFRALDTWHKRWGGESFDGFSIFLDGKIIGATGFIDVNTKAKTAEIGYWLSKDATGKGYMTEAVKALESVAFGDFDFNRIVIRCNADNTGSENVAIRAGYKFQTLFLQDAVLSNGKFRDTKMYYKLKSDWVK
jgi:ribosomal-protein-serine acetyltransferase